VRHHRSQLDRFVHPVADLHRRGRLDQFFQQRLVNLADRDQDRARQAALAGGAKE
jgi:hypothetical protein